MIRSQFVESQEVYEYWVLQKMEGESRVRSSWRFLGLTVNECMDDMSYTLDGKPRLQSEMKAKDYETRTEEEYRAREAYIAATVASLSYRFQNELSLLLQDRERASSNMRYLREWNIIDIQPLKPKIATKAKSWSGWWKGAGGITQWGVIIKGETTLKQEAGSAYGASIKIPDRFSDPFGKYSYGRPIIDRDLDRRRLPDAERVIVPRRPVVYSRPAHYPRSDHHRRPSPTPEMYKKEVESLFHELGKFMDESQVKAENF